tara:strand:+ start:646 stop:909 length:264 start_codon:yes stop_codon:yes gene_type:complete
MKLPVTLEQFIKNPIAAIAFIALVVIGYLYVDMVNIHEQQLSNFESSCLNRIDDHKDRIESLEELNIRYEDKLSEMNEKLMRCLEED